MPTLNGLAHCHSEGVAERGLKNPPAHAAPWILRCTQNDNAGHSYPTVSLYARPLPAPRSLPLTPTPLTLSLSKGEQCSKLRRVLMVRLAHYERLTLLSF